MIVAFCVFLCLISVCFNWFEIPLNWSTYRRRNWTNSDWLEYYVKMHRAMYVESFSPYNRTRSGSFFRFCGIYIFKDWSDGVKPVAKPWAIHLMGNFLAREAKLREQLLEDADSTYFLAVNVFHYRVFRAEPLIMHSHWVGYYTRAFMSRGIWPEAEHDVLLPIAKQCRKYARIHILEPDLLLTGKIQSKRDDWYSNKIAIVTKYLLTRASPVTRWLELEDLMTHRLYKRRACPLYHWYCKFIHNLDPMIMEPERKMEL